MYPLPIVDINGDTVIMIMMTLIFYNMAIRNKEKFLGVRKGVGVSITHGIMRLCQDDWTTHETVVVFKV